MLKEEEIAIRRYVVDGLLDLTLAIVESLRLAVEHARSSQRTRRLPQIQQEHAHKEQEDKDLLTTHHFIRRSCRRFKLVQRRTIRRRFHASKLGQALDETVRTHGFADIVLVKWKRRRVLKTEAL